MPCVQGGRLLRHQESIFSSVHPLAFRRDARARCARPQQKYALAVPFYRQESAWKVLGLPLSRTNMANLVIGLGRGYFFLLAGQMKTSLLTSTVLHADETTVHVYKESGKRTWQKNQVSWMWLYATSPLDSASPDIRIFEYRPRRSFVGGQEMPESWMPWSKETKDNCKA